MLQTLAPTYQTSFDDTVLLWFLKSNKYALVDRDFNNILNHYINATSLADFNCVLNDLDEASDATLVSQHLETFLKDCNTILSEGSTVVLPFNHENRDSSELYQIGDTFIEMHYSNALLKPLFHTALEQYLAKNRSASQKLIFDIHLENGNISLYINEQHVISARQGDYHKIQGKFIMHVICAIHKRLESEWLGTFHGSTITDGNNAVLFIGNSGKGKSTLCALLAQHGFQLLADDVSPMLSEDRKIYSNPNAISIKHGAFEVLKPYLKDFDALPKTSFYQNKGQTAYVPQNTFELKGYSCKAIVMVNYKAGAETALKRTTIAPVLETLIPESWLSHNAKHAKQFMVWLEQVQLYELTYSNTESVVDRISSLFTSFGDTNE
ncbi:MAG: hypothetical protein HRU50_09315 [Winogradskyella sp.]|uniref:hypothetical protein n=1 Tax=Winogradskyella sp. TaxID=1883156 RepID=UPI0025FF9A61|nr:hypothetical protein [Winogradskyella sp.]NRB60117.1 hypothetical protein [Winogradskyella sp.]